jgi:uncharacterized cupin superfamily protein
MSRVFLLIMVTNNIKQSDTTSGAPYDEMACMRLVGGTLENHMCPTRKDHPKNDIGIVHLDEIDWIERDSGGRLVHRRKGLGQAAGGEKLGCTLYEVPSEKRPQPYHYHYGNEEAMFVLSGKGSLRTPDGEQPLEAGTYVSLPTGEENARQVINTSDEPLQYLCMSTTVTPEIAYLPDSDKYFLSAGADPLSNPEEVTLLEFLSVEEGVVDGPNAGQWHGEE